MRKALIIAGIVIILAGLGGLVYYFLLAPQDAGGAPSGPSTVITDREAINAQVVAFIRNPYKDDYEITRIAGYVDNKGETYVKRALIEIQLADDQGNKKELVKYEVKDIPADSRRTFDANAGSIAGTRSATGIITEIEVVE